MKMANTLFERVETIERREDLVAFVRELRDALGRHPEEWENLDLDGYLDAMAAWLAGEPQRRKNLGEPPNEDVEWRTVGELLLAPKYYE